VGGDRCTAAVQSWHPGGGGTKNQPWVPQELGKAQTTVLGPLPAREQTAWTKFELCDHKLRKWKYLPTQLHREEPFPEKLTGPQFFTKFPAFYEARTFITALTTARHLSLSWARSIQSMTLHSTSRRSVLILSFRLPSGLLTSGFPIKTLYAFLPSHMRATCPAHLSLLDHPNNITWGPQSIMLLVT
jgi:hypothetical protein